MKKILLIIICFIPILASYLYGDKVSDFIVKQINNEHNLVIKEHNDYYKNKSYMYVQLDEDYIPYSKQDLLNIIYTVLNNGWDSFTFYCADAYKECIDQMIDISNDSTTLSHINNYVHPFNSFTSMKSSMSESGEITIKINKVYSEDAINRINTKVDELMKEVYNERLTLYDNIKKIHDYIINNARYDSDAKDISATAEGPLFYGEATCNGYTDLMAIILYRLGVDNYKIATMSEDISYESSGHIWNAVYLNNEWLHLDLTWDDPVSGDGKDLLYHKYFLVNNTALKKADSGSVQVEEHNFKNTIYLEFNDSIKDIIS